MKRCQIAFKENAEEAHNREARRIIERIRNQDYEALFAHGCCFHFALHLHEKFKDQIRGIKEGRGANSSHVWCLKIDNGKAIDIRGVYPEELIIRLANSGKTANAYDVSPEAVRALIESKGYPPTLNQKIGNWRIGSLLRMSALKRRHQVMRNWWLAVLKISE